jgi:hypothetical protein
MLSALIPLITSILAAAPAVVADIEAMWKLLTQATPPTRAEQQAIDDALAAAYAAVLNSTP